MSLNEYYSEIRSDIAKEFGFEAIGYGSLKLDKLTALDYLRKWEALSPEEQEAILATRKMWGISHKTRRKEIWFFPENMK